MVKNAAIFTIGLYQKFLRPLAAGSCRFYPSCSEYCKQAIEKYGLLSGGIKSLRRLSQCQPYSAKSGYDPLE